MARETEDDTQQNRRRRRRLEGEDRPRRQVEGQAAAPAGERRRARREGAGEAPGRERRKARRANRQTGAEAHLDAVSKIGPLYAREPAAPWSKDKTGGLLRAAPLIDPDQKIMIYWAPKSACTSVYAYFAALAGYVDEVRDYSSRSPHKHRTQVYNRSDFFKRGVEMDPAALRVVKVIRDPYSRAVSIYRHALKTGFADDDMTAFSNGALNAATGYSMQQFLDLVESLDMGRANIHYRPQTHIFEEVRKPDHVINISKEDMFAALNTFAVACGLQPVDLTQLDWLHKIESGRKAKAQPVDGDAIDQRAFDKEAAQGNTAFPSYEQLLSPEVRARIEKIYAVDFANYRDAL